MALLPYIRSIDWPFIKDVASRDVDLARRVIEKQVLGDMSYMDRLKAANPHKTELELQLAVLRNWKGRPDLKPDKWGKHWHQHFAYFLTLLIPGTFIHPWFLDECWALEYCIANGRDILNLIGSKSSGKSAFIARSFIGLVSIEPDWTCFYIAAPYKTAAESTVWGELRGCFEAMIEAHPKLFPKAAYKLSEDRCDWGRPFKKSAGFIELVSVDKVGKLQGIKAEDKQQVRGFIGIGVDEIGVFPSDKFIDILDNVNANANFLGETGCNFRDMGGMEGRLCHPEGQEYTDLSADEDHYWKSDYNTFTIRLDGHFQPNILAQQVIYGPLLREHKRAVTERKHGLRGPKYLEQIRSFPNSSMSDYYTTTRDKILAAGSFDQILPSGGTTSVAFIDPGFGGDPAQMIVLEWGACQVMSLSGHMVAAQVIRPRVSMITVQIDTALVCDHAWVSRLQRVTAGKMRDITVNIGQLVTAEQQLAVQCGEILARLAIPRSHFGFDGSMRASIVKEMIVVLGSGVVAIDFGGTATDRVTALSQDRQAKELYSNFVTEMYFNAAEVIHAGAFRGAEMVPEALRQMCRRRWFETNKKKQIQPKQTRPGNPVKGYKNENAGQSPNDADALVGGIEMALRKGFTPPLLRKVESVTGATWNPHQAILAASLRSPASPVASRGSARLHRRT